MISFRQVLNMKIRLMSDLHLETNKFQYEYHGEDIVLLLGDIHTHNRHSKISVQIPSNIPIILITMLCILYYTQLSFLW